MTVNIGFLVMNADTPMALLQGPRGKGHALFKDQQASDHPIPQILALAAAEKNENAEGGRTMDGDGNWAGNYMFLKKYLLTTPAHMITQNGTAERKSIHTQIDTSRSYMFIREFHKIQGSVRGDFIGHDSWSGFSPA
jgi:hypothetical protein